MQEEWKDIKGYEGLYQVSNLGRVKRIKRKNNAYNNYYDCNFILKQNKTKKGYLRVQLHKEGTKEKTFFAHRLVAETFLDNPDNLPQVNHKDENKLNNRVDNLEFCTNKYNANYGHKNDSKKKKIIQKDLSGNAIKVWDSIAQIEKELGIKSSNISAICRGLRKTARGYIWEYE